MTDKTLRILRTDLDVRRLVGWLQKLPLKKPWAFEIGPYHKPRSSQANRYLFGVAYPPLMEAMGLRGEREKEELHEVLLGLYFGWKEYEVMGVKKKRPKRTTTTGEDGKRSVLSTPDFAAYADFVIQKAAERGVYIPAPGEYIDAETGEIRAAA